MKKKGFSAEQMKLPALKGDASRKGNFLLYGAPWPPLKGGACGALAGHREAERRSSSKPGEHSG